LNLRKESTLLKIGDWIYRFVDSIASMMSIVTDNRLIHSTESSKSTIALVLLIITPLVVMTLLSYMFFKLVVYDK
jgi:hypothetical protein